MPQPPSELLYGTLDILILKTLTWQAMHGYAISGWLRQHSDGELEIDDASLYKALHRLERDGHITSTWGRSENNRRARFYALTARGRRQLRSESTTWQRYARVVFRILETA